MDKPVSSKHLETISDLTLLAPIKQGFVAAFESVTYETRLQLLLKALFKVRSTAREHSMIKPFVDTAERIQSLLDFRLAVLDTEPPQLMLSATFDRSFEPYMRLIWDPLGPLLDVIFCNCDGYVTATGHGFEEYLAWVRKSQVDSDFFYSMSGHSVSDLQYLLKIERLQREQKGKSGAAIYVGSPEEDAAEVRKDEPRPSAFLGVEALTALYRLTDFYPPDDPNGDGELLRQAVRQLLRGWDHDVPAEWEKLIPEQLAWFRGGGKGSEPQETIPENTQEGRNSSEEKRAAKRGKAERLKFDLGDIQSGILEAPDGARPVIRHGAMLFMGIVDLERARNFLAELADRICNGRNEAPKPVKDVFLNLAFTWRGLQRLGLSGPDLIRFPQEFREGMEERAGLIGDLRAQHPRRWRQPLRAGSIAAGDSAQPARIELSEVDFVVQLRTPNVHAREAGAKAGQPATIAGDVLDDQDHPLHQAVRELDQLAAEHGVRLLAVETMRRASHDSEDPGKNHFGFADGISQPKAVDGEPDRSRDQVARGELLLGYSNDRADPPPPPSTILDNGTFLVVRKLRQHVGRLRDSVAAAAAANRVDKEILYGKLAGRMRDGAPMIAGAGPTQNDFTYKDDPTGLECPLQAHIRRTNPRAKREGNTRRPTPRILRRGLSYGPPLAEDQADDGAERGVMFMAYCASIAEQFEVIQRWVNGGNPTGIGSWLSDPLMGVPKGEPPRRVRFHCAEAGGTVAPAEAPKPAADGASNVAAQILQLGQGGPSPEAATSLRDDKQEAPSGTVRIEQADPFVELEWGLYLFVPSIAAIRAVVAPSPVQAREESAGRAAEEARRGERIIARLRALADAGPDGAVAAALGWKVCLEDFRSKDPGERGEAQAVWSAIRTHHGGALRVPYGAVAPGQAPPEVVLVGGKDLVMSVFQNWEQHYSMCGQMARMKQSFGPIFLGLDGGEEYDKRAQINDAVHAIGEATAFAPAYLSASESLRRALTLFAGMKFPDDPPTGSGNWGELDLRRDFITPVLGAICNYWFGIPDTLTPPGLKPGEAEGRAHDRCDPNHVDLGGWSGDPLRKPRCPGDFLATSRYCFYPDPVPRVQAYGRAQGKALRDAVRGHFEEVAEPQAPIAKAMNQLPIYKNDRDEFARTLIGIMTGFLPPTDATLRWTLYEWLEEKLFWRLQQDFISAQAKTSPADDQAFAGSGLDAATAERLKESYARAKATLTEPLRRAMKKRPSPDMLWRTAVRPHHLGGVEVNNGDRVFLGIVSAMAEGEDTGGTDVYPIFGGAREGLSHPQHACPAYSFAMGTMLGILAALMDAVVVQALPTPLLVRIRAGVSAPAAPAVVSAPPHIDDSQPLREESSAAAPQP